MHTVLRRLAPLLASVAMAAWLRMFDQTLSWQSWPNLVGKPLSRWIAGAVAMPLFELLYHWPYYLAAGALFYSISFSPGLRLGGQNPGLAPHVLLGTAIGAGLYLMAMAATEWLMRSPAHNLKLLLLYAATGAFFGWLCFRFETPRLREGKKLVS